VSGAGGSIGVRSWAAHAVKLLPLLLIAAGLAVYYNSFDGASFFDDHPSIRDNPRIRRLWPLWEAMSWPVPGAIHGRPVAALSLAINYALGGLRVWGYHAFNVTIHILASLALFGIVRRTLIGTRFRDRVGPDAPWLAMAVALIWLVHPLQTESVDYIVQRTEGLMGFFLLTLYCVVRGAASSRQRGWYAGAVISCALGMGSKEVMAVAPLTVLLYDRAFLARSFREALRVRAALYAGLAGSWLVPAALVASGAHGESAGFGLSVTPWEYARTQAGVMIIHYLRLSFWPRPLVVDYYDWPVARTAAVVVPAGALVIGLLAATLWAARRRPWLV